MLTNHTTSTPHHQSVDHDIFRHTLWTEQPPDGLGHSALLSHHGAQNALAELSLVQLVGVQMSEVPSCNVERLRSGFGERLASPEQGRKGPEKNDEERLKILKKYKL